MKFIAALYFWVDEIFPLVDPNLPKDYTDFSPEQREKF